MKKYLLFVLILILFIGCGGNNLAHNYIKKTIPKKFYKLKIYSTPKPDYVLIEKTVYFNTKFKLPEGVYTIEVYKVGYKPFIKYLILEKNTNLYVKLKKLPYKSQYEDSKEDYKLKITSNVKPDLIIVDDKKYYTTEFELSRGIHKIVVLKEGYMPLKTVIDMQRNVNYRIYLMKGMAKNVKVIDYRTPPKKTYQNVTKNKSLVNEVSYNKVSQKVDDEVSQNEPSFEEVAQEVEKEFNQKINKLAISLLNPNEKDFVRDDDKQVVIDKDRGLMWQDNLDKDSLKLTYQEAVNYCKMLKLGGYTDWRVPKIEELSTIIDISRYNPAIVDSFVNVGNDDAKYMWSSTLRNHCCGDLMYTIYIRKGNISSWSKNKIHMVKCVRNIKEKK